MRRLIYMSEATQPVDGEMLDSILMKARANNGMCGVTGLLLYHDGTFLQCLEGPNSGVQRILDKISADGRHRKIKTLCDDEVEDRLFASWEMGFRPELSKQERMGFVDIRTKASSGTGNQKVDGAIAEYFSSLSDIEKAA